MTRNAPPAQDLFGKHRAALGRSNPDPERSGRKPHLDGLGVPVTITDSHLGPAVVTKTQDFTGPGKRASMCATKIEVDDVFEPSYRHQIHLNRWCLGWSWHTPIVATNSSFAIEHAITMFVDPQRDGVITHTAEPRRSVQATEEDPAP
jgi:hypothetical protein